MPHLHLLRYLLVYLSDRHGVVRSLVGQLDGIAVVFLCHVPELQTDAFLFNLLDMEVAEAVVFVTDARDHLCIRKAVSEVVVDSVVESLGEPTTGAVDDDDLLEAVVSKSRGPRKGESMYRDLVARSEFLTLLDRCKGLFHSAIDCHDVGTLFGLTTHDGGIACH